MTIARLASKTYIVDASSTVVLFDAQPTDKFTHVIIKNEAGSTAPCAVSFHESAAPTALTYPVSSSTGATVTANGIVCKTVFPGQVESYEKGLDARYCQVIMPTGATGKVHITPVTGK